jgi:lysophospholipase L1-like esterase
MIRSRLFHLTLFLLASFHIMNAQENIIQNSSFEQNVAGDYIRLYKTFFPKAPSPNPKGLVKGNTDLIKLDDSTAHSGEYSLRVSSEEPVRCGVNQSGLPLIAGQKIRFSVWMKGEGLNPRGKMPGGVVRLAFTNSKDPAAHRIAYKQSGFLKSPAEDFDWTYVTSEVTVPEEADQMEVGCFLWESSGTVWFDDLSVEVIDGPQNPEDSLPDPDGMRRYQAANAALLPPQPGEQRVVFYGDSIIDIWDLEKYFPGEGFINRGIGGQHTGQMRVRLEQDVLALKPSVVWFLGGTNDIPWRRTDAMIAENVRQMARACREHGIKFIICSVLPVSDYHKDRSERLERTKLRPPARILSVNKLLKQVAAEEGAEYLDLFSAMVDASGQMPADYAQDGLHPSHHGYQVMAPLVLKAINAAKAE